MSHTPGGAYTPADAATLNGDSTPRGVDVQSAERDFNELNRQLSNPKNAKSTASTEKTVDDAEKGADKTDDDSFNLRDYLASSTDANQAAGIQHKHVAVTWQDLRVEVNGGQDHKIYIRTFGNACVEFFVGPFLWLWSLIASVLPSKEPARRTILHKSSGVLKPGEMCLVLACPNGGASTFLKTIANQRSTYGKISGEVLYAGIDHETMHKYYKGEVVYNEEDDIHIATLTVAQTLAFALSTKTPGPNGRLPGVSRKEFDARVQDTFLKMLNISHTAQTLVGNEFVRGVSGGERKRVSIAEMLATRAHVSSWDNSTRGLDASTALDFAKSLRIMTDILGQTTFVSLYQAGEGIYDQFDKVLVIDKGHQIYYGPPQEARAYFEGLGFKPLPRQSTADYLTGCTDPNERQFAEGRSENDVPSTPEALEQAFQQSMIAKELRDTIEKTKLAMETERADQDAFRAAVNADKKKGVSKKSPYTLSFIGQIRTLSARQFRMRLQDKFQLYTSFSLSIILACVIGGAFIDLPLTSAGGFTRGSVVFIALLTTCLDAFGEMPTQMLGRPILHKQTAYSMYRPAAITMANTLADLPFTAIRVFMFNIIVYFMSHLHRSAGGFFAFHFFNYLAFLAMQGFFRTLGLICVNFDSAFRLATFFIPNMIQYSGYMISIARMKRWLFWISYINPVAYAWQACIENEFMRINLTCDGTYITPRNIGAMTKYPSGLGPNQACTLPGDLNSRAQVTGESYINRAYSLDVADLWRRNLVVLLAFFIAFQVTQLIVIEWFPVAVNNLSIPIHARASADIKKRNAVLAEKKRVKEEHRREKTVVANKEIETRDDTHRKTFTWENLNYTVPVPSGHLRLLHDVQGYVKPGTITALMGASGAGKTTCLDVLAQRKNIGVVAGDLLIDGRPLDSDFARGTAYAEQMDVHEGTSTVREAMRFSAYLRQPAEISKEEKDEYVEEMLELLELQDLADALVFSLGVEARKRLTIGVELAAKPSLLLFLDEPTSGLDAQSAWNLVRFLRKLADQGQAILCTIHQPSALLFESFDRLLLLERGGETVYFGDIGQDSVVIRDYFARQGAHCPGDTNMAEYMLEAIGAGIAKRVGDRDYKDIWLESPECAVVREEIAAIKDEGLALPAPDKKALSTYATSFLYQLKVVVQRNNLALWRSPDYVFSRMFVHVFIALFVSLPFLQLGNSANDLQSRIFGIFWVGVLPAIIMAQLQPMFIFNRRIFIREASSRIYSPYVFAIGQLIGEFPYSVVCAFLYWLFMVFPMGYGQGSAGTNGLGFQLLMTIVMELFGVTLGQFLGSIAPSVQVAVLFNPFIAVTLGNFSGVTIPYPTMDSFWKSWLYELDPYTRYISAMLSTELHGLVIKCKPEELTIFNPPSGETCAKWASDFVTAAGGYLENPDATEQCGYCQYSVGDEFYEPLNIRFSNRWRDFGILLLFIAFNVCGTIVASRFLRYAKR